MMPDNEAEIIEAAREAAYLKEARLQGALTKFAPRQPDRYAEFFDAMTTFAEAVRETKDEEARGPIERLQARIAQLERDSNLVAEAVPDLGNSITGASEFICDRCGGPNPIAWHAPSPLWNRVMRFDEPEVGFCCPSCFIMVAQERGIDGSWHLTFDEADMDAMWTDIAGRRWNPETCLWDEPTESDGDPQDREEVDVLVEARQASGSTNEP